MSSYPRVYTHGKDWNWRRNGIAERRRRRIHERSAESFPSSHGRNLYLERVLGTRPDHENLKDTVTLRGVKCTGAPACTGPREVSNNPGSVKTDFYHHHWINYQKSVNSQTAPPHAYMVYGCDQDRVCEGQHVSLRPHMWYGSKPRRERDNRLRATVNAKMKG